MLVPLAGHGHHSRLRARLLASLTRSEECEITFLRSVPPGTRPHERLRAEKEVRALARNESEGRFEVVIEDDQNPVDTIQRHTAEADLVVMGFQHGPGAHRVFGPVIRELIDRCETPLILLGSRRTRPLRSSP